MFSNPFEGLPSSKQTREEDSEIDLDPEYLAPSRRSLSKRGATQESRAGRTRPSYLLSEEPRIVQAKKKFVETLQYGSIPYASSLWRDGILSDDFVRPIVIEELAWALEKTLWERVEVIAYEFSNLTNIFSDKKIQQAAEITTERLTEEVAGDKLRYMIDSIIDQLSLPDEIWISSVYKQLILDLQTAEIHPSHLLRIMARFPPPNDFFASPENAEVACTWIRYYRFEEEDENETGEERQYLQVVGSFHLPENILMSEPLRQRGRNHFFWALEHGHQGIANMVADVFHLDKEKIAFLEDETIPQSIRRSREFKDAIFDTRQEASTARSTHGLSPREYEHIATSKENAVLEKDTKGKLKNPDALIEIIKSQQNEAIRRALAIGQRLFGSEAMLRYMNRPDLSRHDAVFFFPQLNEVMERNGLDAEQFRNNILEQVAKDDAKYVEGSAHHRFGGIMQRLRSTSIQDALERGEKYRGSMQRLDELLKKISRDPVAIFSSWKALKNFSDMVDLLNKTETLELLLNIDNPRLKSYAEELLFHPNIDTHSVKLFLEHPEEFFDIDDEHASEALNHAKKPANLLTLPFLGVHAEDLRDALVGRKGESQSALDRLQAIPPFETVYRIGREPRKESDPTRLHDLILNIGIGKLRDRRPGIAKNPKRLLTEVQRVLGSIEDQKIFPSRLFPTGDSARRFKAFADTHEGPLLIETLAASHPDAFHALQEVAYHPEFGIQLKDDRPEYRVRIGQKSDPSIAIAGNDTASCMPFGSGKNNVYQINPNCAQLVVERSVISPDGSRTYRTAAQSVVTLDYQASKNVPELMRLYQDQNANLVDLLAPEELVQKPVLTFDNIEVAKNDLGSRLEEIKEVYERFTKEYLAEKAKELGLDPTRSIVGMNYTPEGIGLATIPNHFVPAAPASYSDNTLENCYEIRTGAHDPNPKPELPRMIPMSMRDILTVAYLEGKAYADNPSLLEYLHKVQNSIMGMTIANEYYNRPNLSFVYHNEKGIPSGYIVAYEGIASVTYPEKIVYISDMAADPSGRFIAGARLLQQFYKAFIEAYTKEGNTPPPIFTNAREQTSYKMIQRQTESLANQAGLQSRIIEIGAYERDGDIFHDVLIVFGRSEDELSVAAERARQAIDGASLDKEPDTYT